MREAFSTNWRAEKCTEHLDVNLEGRDSSEGKDVDGSEM
jgi:hypothetical protein